jgi:hypothetical protein
MTIGAQSVKGIMPRRITSFSLTSGCEGPADVSNSNKKGSANHLLIDFISDVIFLMMVDVKV